MAEENPTPPANPPAETPPAPATPPAQDSNRIAEELGQTKAKMTQYEEYIKQVVPILQAVNEDAELSAKVIEVTNKKLGITPPPPTTTENKPLTPPPPDPIAVETRSAFVQDKINDFFASKGIDKLSDEEQKRIAGMIANQFSELVDPKGNKSFAQAVTDVAPTKLGHFLENSWSLVENQLVKKEDPVVPQLNRAGVPGALSSPTSATSEAEESPDNMRLSAAEKKTAASMGISEETYLQNKRDLEKARRSEEYA